MRTLTTITLLFVLALATTAEAAPSWAERWQSARFKTLEYPDSEFSVRENQLTVAAAARLFDVSEARMRCIVQRESGWNEKAQNPTSTAAGLWQFVAGTWESSAPHYAERARAALSIAPTASRLNSRAATLVAGSMLRSGQWFHWGPGSC